MKALSDWIDYIVLNTTTEDVDYPSDNLKINTSSTESYRTTNTSASVVDLDLGTAIQNPTILIYKCNFIDFDIYGDDDSAFGSIDFTLQDLTTEYDPEMFIYKKAVTLTGCNTRYIRLNIHAQQTTDGGNYFEIGVLGMFDELQDFSTLGGSLGLPVEVTMLNSEIINRYETNRKDIIQLSPLPVFEFRITGTMINSPANRQKMADVFGHPQKSVVFMDRTIEVGWQCYILQRTAQLTASEQSPGIAGVRTYSIIFETIL